ncbi:MAG: hypothetical protein DHS20C08_00390 [Rhodomicrobium sp.]|nr:MAG: hypothetical protein DHS20C08_00390 [Rhodomicrobium sp.]
MHAAAGCAAAGAYRDGRDIDDICDRNSLAHNNAGQCHYNSGGTQGVNFPIYRKRKNSGICAEGSCIYVDRASLDYVDADGAYAETADSRAISPCHNDDYNGGQFLGCQYLPQMRPRLG